MSKGEITQKSEISKLLGAKPVLPGENADEYAAGLAALIAELDAKTVLQIYLAEKIYDCLWWIRRYEVQKRMVMIVVMAEIVQGHYPAVGTIDAVEFREALISEAVTAEMVEALQGMGYTIESLKQQALTRKARERRASLNAVSHGLSAPADPAWREGKVSAIEGALQGERLPDADVRQVVEAIFEFERNIAHQREIFAKRHAGDDEGIGESGHLEADAALPDEIDEMLMIEERHGGPGEDERSWLIEAQTFMKRQQRLNHARAKRDAVEEIVRADRYMRRAANQLVKALKASLKVL